MIKAVVAATLVLWVGGVVLLRYFGAVHREQEEREARLNHREASLELWSCELEEIAGGPVVRARARARATLDRAFGPEPVKSNGGSL